MRGASKCAAREGDVVVKRPTEEVRALPALAPSRPPEVQHVVVLPSASSRGAVLREW